MKQFLELCSQNPQGLVGTWVKIPTLLSIELLAKSGFDFVVIDMEHAPHSLAQAYDFIATAQTHGMAAVVRLPDHLGTDIQRLLDAGADGLLVPRMDSIDSADAITRRMIFSPAGERGLGSTSRAGSWGLSPLEDYLRRGDEQCLRMIQLEDWESLQRAEAFLAVSGVNGVFVGLGDLFLSSGKPATDPEVLALVESVARSARQAGKLSGIAAATPEEAGRYLRLGYSMVMVSNDATMFARAASTALQQTRAAGRP